MRRRGRRSIRLRVSQSLPPSTRHSTWRSPRYSVQSLDGRLVLRPMDQGARLIVQRPWRDETRPASLPTGTRGLITLETFSMTDFSSEASVPVRRRKLSAFFNVVRTCESAGVASPQCGHKLYLATRLCNELTNGRTDTISGDYHHRRRDTEQDLCLNLTGKQSCSACTVNAKSKTKFRLRSHSQFAELLHNFFCVR